MRQLAYEDVYLLNGYCMKKGRWYIIILLVDE